MADPLRVVAPCGCEYDLKAISHGHVVTRVRTCGGAHHAIDFYWQALLQDRALDVLRIGYAIAASEGRGPWAKLWPGRRT